jgi:tetratricopeptide (TPR) repeat protein
MKLRKLTEEKTFKSTVTIFLACLTFVGSLIVSLNIAASGRGAAAGRDSRILGIRSLTHLGRTLWDAASEKRLMVAWQELGGLMMQSEAYEKMTGGKDAALYRLTRERLTKVRDLLAAQGQVTQAPYFDPKAGASDFFQYYIDRVFVPAAELLERQEVKKREGGFWGSKTDAFTTALAVLAVAVFLLTLSLVLSGKIRFFMAGTGLFLVLGVVAVAATTAARTWRGPAEESIVRVARASGAATRAQLVLDIGGDLAAAGDFAGRAEKDLEQALAADPEYTTALLLQNRVVAVKGESLFYSGKVEEGRAEIAKAVAGIGRIVKAGREDGYIWWTRAYGELLRGRMDESLRSAEKSLSALPDRAFALGVLKAAALLAGGKKEESEAALESAISQALERPLASDPIDFRTMIKNLERWGEVAPVEGREAMIRRLKEAAVSIAALKKARPEPATAEIAAPTFVSPVYDDRGEIIDVPPRKEFPRFTARAHFLLELKGMKKGQSIVSKVFWKPQGRVFWIEQLRLGKTQHWESPESSARLLGTVENPMPEAGEVLSSGDYRLEYYVDGNLAAVGSFIIL